MKKVLVFILSSMITIGIGAQGYVPKVGETIMFYPLTEKAKQKYLGYDCFYDATKVTSKGDYKFKDSYRYKFAKNGLTPFNEIEDKSFKVLKSEYYMHKGKQENKVFLLFLSCINDGSEIVLRVPFHEKNVSYLTNNLIIESEIEKYSYRIKEFYVNLPCMPLSYMNDIKNKFQGEELLYKENYERKLNGDLDYKSQRERKNIIENIALGVNSDVEGLVFDIERCKKCIDVKFEECDISVYAHPFAVCTYQFGLVNDTVKIPLTYIAGKNSNYNHNTFSNYLFENFFVVKENELDSILYDENKLWIVEKFKGKKVYYGINGVFNYKDEGLSKYVTSKIQRIVDNGQYILKEGNYNCLTFDIYKDSQNSTNVYAILSDSSGIKFRVPVTSPISSKEYRDIIKKHRLLLTFQDCFMLVDEAYALKEEQRLQYIQEEKEKKERYTSWVKKYGVSYAEYLNELTEIKREKFERLAPKYGKATAKLMLEGKVKLGWNKQMCIESWGEPDDINRTTGSWGTHEQWVYGDIYCDYLYFENGVLTSIQN